MGERVPQDTLAKFHWSLSRVGEPKAPGTEWTAELPRVGNSWFRVQRSRLDFSALELVRTPFISQPIAPRGTGTLKSQSGNLETEPQTFSFLDLSFLDLSLFLWRRSIPVRFNFRKRWRVLKFHRWINSESTRLAERPFLLNIAAK